MDRIMDKQFPAPYDRRKNLKNADFGQDFGQESANEQTRSAKCKRRMRNPAFSAQKTKKRTCISASSYGADGRIRTGDLILTKDALYRLSYISAAPFPLTRDLLYYTSRQKARGFSKFSIFFLQGSARPQSAGGAEASASAVPAHSRPQFRPARRFPGRRAAVPS